MWAQNAYSSPSRASYSQSKLADMKRANLTTILLSMFAQSYYNCATTKRTREHPRTQHLCLVPSARFTDTICLRFSVQNTPPIGRVGWPGSARAASPIRFPRFWPDGLPALPADP